MISIVKYWIVSGIINEGRIGILSNVAVLCARIILMSVVVIIKIIIWILRRRWRQTEMWCGISFSIRRHHVAYGGCRIHISRITVRRPICIKLTHTIELISISPGQPRCTFIGPPRLLIMSIQQTSRPGCRQRWIWGRWTRNGSPRSKRIWARVGRCTTRFWKKRTIDVNYLFVPVRRKRIF